MAVTANTNETYDVTNMREDMQEALISISPTECPFMSMAGRKDISNTYFEWNTLALAAANESNRVIEGDSAPANDAATNSIRLGNYTQISDKVVEVSDTANAVNGAANAQTMSVQVASKIKELKIDMETMLLANVAGAAGASGTARSTAGLAAFLRTNVSRGATGANGTLSGTTSGYPDAAATDGTLRALTENIFKTVIADCWDAGAEPSMVLCGSGVKQKISSTFTGSNTRQIDIVAKKIVAAVDIYVSDFGQLQIVPTRFIRTRDVFVIDPSYVKVGYLQTLRQKPLARTGHSERRMMSVEYGLQVDTENAHGIIADINPAL